jgi:hypothetical protein
MPDDSVIDTDRPLARNPRANYPRTLLYLLGAQLLTGGTTDSWNLTPLLHLRSPIASSNWFDTNKVVVVCPELKYTDLAAKTFNSRQPYSYLQPKSRLATAFEAAVQAFTDAQRLRVRVHICTSSNAAALLHHPAMHSDAFNKPSVQHFDIEGRAGIIATLNLWLVTGELKKLLSFDNYWSYVMSTVLELEFGSDWSDHQLVDRLGGTAYAPERLHELYKQFAERPWDTLTRLDNVWNSQRACGYDHITVVSPAEGGGFCREVARVEDFYDRSERHHPGAGS